MRYLSEKISELPKNCLFDKGKVGCGGTTLAIEGDEPYVIAVPFASLVENKARQYPNERCSYKLFGVSEGVTVEDIKKYLKKAKMQKIITTYDGLEKVVKACEGDVSQLNLLIDEYHILFHHYSFRKAAIQSVLNLYKGFKTYTFMTATPLDEDSLLNELKHLPLVKQEWEEDEKFEVTVKATKCRDVIASTLKLIKAFLTGECEGNAYFFINSTNAIKKLVKMAGLNDNNCRAIYSLSNTMNVGLSRCTLEDSKPKKINFLTSTVFEGCDIFDEDAVTIIVSDPYRSHTLLDISTSVQQIAGRIRNSKYIGEIHHLYGSDSRYKTEMSIDEFKAQIEKEVEKVRSAVEQYNGLSEEARGMMKEIGSPYVVKNEDNTFSFDENKPKIDLFNYKVHHIYKSVVTVGREYKNVGIGVEKSRENITIEDLNLDGGVGIDLDFKETVQLLRQSSGFLWTVRLSEAKTIYPFIGEAIDKLGYERIESLKYVQKDIINELIIVADASIDYKICKKLGYREGEYYTNDRIKKDLEKAYKALKLKRAPIAKHIAKYYTVQPVRKRERGKQKEGYLIIKPLYVDKP